MVIFEIFKRQNLIKIYTKTHHLKKFSRGSIPPNPPGKARDTYFSPILSPHV